MLIIDRPNDMESKTPYSEQLKTLFSDKTFLYILLGSILLISTYNSMFNVSSAIFYTVNISEQLYGRTKLGIQLLGLFGAFVYSTYFSKYTN